MPPLRRHTHGEPVPRRPLSHIAVITSFIDLICIYPAALTDREILWRYESDKPPMQKSGYFWSSYTSILCNDIVDQWEQHILFTCFVATGKSLQPNGKLFISVYDDAPFIWPKWTVTTSCLVFSGELPSLYYTFHWSFLSWSSALDRILCKHTLRSEKNYGLILIFRNYLCRNGKCRILTKIIYGHRDNIYETDSKCCIIECQFNNRILLKIPKH
jgi:hypothetical protein